MRIEERAAYRAENPDCILGLDELSTRTINALFHAGLTKISVLRQTPDGKLSKVRNIGDKCMEEINNAIPDRIRTFEGETERLNAWHIKRKTDIDARRILRFMEKDNMKLSELMASSYRLRGLKRARQLLTEYCLFYPERIDEVLEHFEAMNDTGDRFYIFLKTVSTTLTMKTEM